jgi:N-sulfoglucosamine sulfohydrolase
MKITNFLPSALLVATFGQVDGKATDLTKPNIILILSDDHSAPYLGCYGNPDLKTPNIDRIANEGILFNRAYTTAPQCVPSRASILTGRNVLDVQMLRFSAPLDKNIITFPEILRKAGYFTGICGRTYHLDGSGGANMPKETSETFDEFGMVTFKKRVDYLNTGSDEKVLSQVVEFLDKVPAKQPFSLWVNYSDPHRIYNAKEFEPDPSKLHIPELMPDTKLLREDLAGYFGEIQRLDTKIGLLLAELGKRSQLDNTMIVFMGDNGGALLRGKGTLYDCGIHVPLLVRWPGKIKPGTKSDIQVSGEDIEPTILSAAGVQPDDQMTGKSFLPALLGNEVAIRDFVFAVRGAHGSGLPGTTDAFDLSRVVFNKKYKLIYNPLFQFPYRPVDFAGNGFWQELVQLNRENKLEKRFSGTTLFTDQRPMFELFDLQKDPGEFINLSGNTEFITIEHQMKAALQRWMIIYRDMIPLPIPVIK